jgi:hypothetical protein
MEFYGDDPYSERYDADFRRRVSWVTLFWITLKRKSAAARAA